MQWKATLAFGDHALACREALSSAIHLQRRDKRFLRDVDLAELPHLLLAFLLLFQKLAFAGDIAAIAFCPINYDYS
jgi:hypothetical protein